jgi:hypothetical protein
MTLEDTTYAIWAGLDAFFTFCKTIIENIFNAIPQPAMTFLIAIISYSLSAYITWGIGRASGYQEILLKAFKLGFTILVILFAIWRIGVPLMQLIPNDPFANLTSVLINMLYIFMAAVLLYAFYLRNPWLKKAFLTISWIMFLLITFLIAPALTDFMPTNQTLWQVLEIAVLFSAPGFLLFIQSKDQEGIDIE